MSAGALGERGDGQPFRLVDRLTESQIRDLHGLYQNEWWTKDRELADVEAMLQHTDVVVGFCEPQSGKLVAFARVISDFRYKALILDVIVDAACRGSGLGRLAIDAILAHPALKAVRHFELYCRPELVPFYQKWGFTSDLGGVQAMRLARQPKPQVEIVSGATGEPISLIRELFSAYAASLDFSLDFQDFGRELEGLPGAYEAPKGCLLLATSDGAAAGCVAMRALTPGVCEMKRLYVRPQFRGQAIGRRLAQAVIQKAREAGYQKMRLDTVPSMNEAVVLYQSLGFVEIAPYTHNPIPGAMYFELNLHVAETSPS